jgi:hypothetical protein
LATPSRIPFVEDCIRQSLPNKTLILFHWKYQKGGNNILRNQIDVFGYTARRLRAVVLD